MSVQRWRETHYTPEDDVKSIVDALPNRATASVDVEIYGLTDLVLVTSLIAAHGRGVNVRVMNDRSQAGGPSDKRALQLLIDAGVAVKVVESTKGAIDHLKQIVIDGDRGALDDASCVLKGSYNFSDGAQKQDNFVDVTNDPGEVAQAIAKFTADWTMNEQKPEWQIQPSAPIAT